LRSVLHRGHDGAVDDADDTATVIITGVAQRRRLGKQFQTEADQPVRTELQQHAGQDHRTGGRRFGVGVG
jgi:hypothetical protein